MRVLERKYEAILIASPELNEEQLNKLQSQFAEVVARHQGRVLGVTVLGKKKLGYMIGERSEGLYLQILIEVLPSQVAGIEKAAKTMDSCLRFMLTRDSGFSLPVAAGGSPSEGAAPKTQMTGSETAKIVQG